MSKELQAIFTLDEKQQKTEKRINQVADDLKDLKENAPLFNVECDELQKALKCKVIQELGGKKSEAYKNKPLRTKVFIDAQSQVKREFGVKSYKAIKRCQLEKAMEIVSNYKIPTVIQEIVDVLNQQVKILKEEIDN